LKDLKRESPQVLKRAFAGGLELILLDLMLPGMNGYEICKTIRKKIESDPSKPRHIQTLWGAGYRFMK
jgi:DNA-binding response OmpR family regulator